MTRQLAYLMLAAFPLLSGCETIGEVREVPLARIAETGDSASPQETGDGASGEAGEPDEAIEGGIQRLRSLDRSRSARVQEDWSERFPDNNALRVAVEDMPLDQFLHYSFGELLGVNYVIAEQIANLDDPVSLNLQESVSSRRLYTLALELLAGRDVGVTYRDGVFYLHPADRQGNGGVFIGLGSRPQDVPERPGPLLQIIPLQYGLSPSIERTIRGLVDAQVIGDPEQSALFVTGERFQILRVLDIVGLLDQPSQRGRYVGLVSLTFLTAEEFMAEIADLLSVEGVPVSIGPDAGGARVTLVSLESIGAVAVFSASRQLFDRVNFWARQIDQPAQGAERRYYIYTPRYARADELGLSLAPLLGDPAAAGGDGDDPRDTRSAIQTQQTGGFINSALSNRRDDYGSRAPGGARPTVSVRSEDLTMSVDLRSNALIFNTTGMRYQSLLPMIRRLDTPPRQILLEATIAEVLLTDQFALGVEFALQSGDTEVGTTGGLGLPSGGGFISIIGNDGAVRAQISESNRLVNILSNPTLVVRDGVNASISVGNDIPTIGATFFDPIESGTQITSVQYRKTGVNLSVRPTLNAQGLVVMEISQDISNTVEGGSDVEGTPAIFERSLSTEVVARSGETVLLGGLISENKTDNVARVPWLGRIPVLGRLFRSDIQSTERTELVVMITPQVLDENTRWDSILNRLNTVLRHVTLNVDESDESERGENATQ